MALTETPYGFVLWFADMETVRITATQHQLYAWAHRPGMSWPCSVLARCDVVNVTFSADGLVDVDHEPVDDIPADEFNAWASDVLRDVLPQSHPAWFVTVGQFQN